MSAKNIDDQEFENQPSEATDSSYDEAYEDDVTYTEDDSSEWSDDVELTDEDESQDEEPAPQKKKTSNLTIAIIVVVAIIGVFGFMILTGNQNGATQPGAEAQQGAVTIDADADQDSITDLKQQADQNSEGDQSANISTPAPAPTPAVPQQGLMENPQLADSNTDVPPLPVITTNDQSPALTAPADLGSAPPQDVVTAISPTVKPVSDFPTVDSIKKPDAAPVDATPVVTEVAPILPIPSAVPAKADQSAQLQAQVDAAQKKIDLLEKQLADQALELAAQKQAAAKAASIPAGSSEAEVDSLKEQIATLEEKLAAKVDIAVAKTSVKTMVADRAPSEDDSYSSNEPVVKKAPVIAKPKVVTRQQSWSLKSAGAGKAILSDKATGDLKTVRVGDVVSGLGRIVSISNNKSSWIVKGTSGSVSE